VYYVPSKENPADTFTRALCIVGEESDEAYSAHHHPFLFLKIVFSSLFLSSSEKIWLLYAQSKKYPATGAG
jgi:hypothetical protein